MEVGTVKRRHASSLASLKALFGSGKQPDWLTQQVLSMDGGGHHGSGREHGQRQGNTPSGTY